MPLALKRKALARKAPPRITRFEPVDVAEAVRRHPEKAGLVELLGPGGPAEGVGEALAAVAARYPERLWAARLDAAAFPKMIGEFLEARGMTRAEFDRALPAVGLVREGRLFSLLRPSTGSLRGRSAVRTLTEQIDAFAYKFAVAFTPAPKAEGPLKAVGAPRVEVNRDKPVAVTVTRGGTARSVTLYEGENLLDGALERGVELDYSCKQGKCDTCTVTVVRGRENLSEPTEGERKVLGELLQEGRRLSCQVIVRGPVEIRQ